MPPPEQRHGCWGNDAGQLKVSFPDHPRRVTSPQKVASTPDEVDIVVPESAKTNAEDLGIETIAGLEAHGHRFTDTIPSGEIGNDRPILAVQEIWSAAGLDFPLRDVRTDPRFGKRVREVVRLDLAEPDPALFEPPADYEMKTEELRQIPCPQ